jgi:hypothetical protein
MKRSILKGLGIDLSRGFDDVQDRLWARHSEGVMSARMYRAALAELRREFNLPPAQYDYKAPPMTRLRLERGILAVIGAKMGRLQDAINMKEANAIAFIPDAIQRKMTVETGPVDIQVHPYCNRDGEVDWDSAEVTADFTVTVKYSARCGVRV